MNGQCKIASNQVELRMNASPQFLCIARQATNRMAQMVGLSEKDVDMVTLAVEEALTNVIQHGYGGPCDEPIIMQFRQIASSHGRPARLEITVRDFGKQVDPTCIKSRDLDDIRPGGLGVHIIKSIMDEIGYSCESGGGMKLQMVKYVRE